jgi:hypothetical protein
MLTSNEFLGGIDKDTDVLKIENTKLRDARNIRILNKDGQGLVVTNIGGNELSFNLSPGFIPLGHDEYNGVAYILSYNPTTGEGEYGTFPSPFPGYVGGFQTVYSPLYNYTGAVNPTTPGAVKVPFRTKLFNVDCEHQARVKVRIDYDNSVNIYWTDYKNPIRSINCGFNQEGIFNGRAYWDGSFPNAVDLISETCAQPIVNLGTFNPAIGEYENGVIPGGCLNSGTYFFFFRYNTLNFNPTSYVAESSAIQVSPNLDSDSIKIQGAPGYPAASITRSGKQAILTLSNIDLNYPYLEVAFLNYHDNTVTTGVIDILFPIPTGTTTLEVNISGCEPVRDATLADILSKKINYDIVKDIAQLENRLWGANCKTREIFDPVMLQFAKNIIPRPDDSLQIPDMPFIYSSTTPMSYLQHKDYNHTYNTTGYFRGETYAFTVRFVFKNGRLSEPIPIGGYDAWMDPGAINQNDQGILRFPNLSTDPGQSPFTTMGATKDLKIMGVRFDVTAVAQAIFNGSSFLTDNICGFYFCRGERVPNLVYQGVSVACFTALHDTHAGWDDFGPVCTPWLFDSNAVPTEQNYTANCVPFVFFRRMSMKAHCTPIIGIGADYYYLGYHPVTPVRNRYGFFSSDHFFKKTFNNKRYVMQSFAELTYSGPSVFNYYVADVGIFNWLNSSNKHSPFAYNVQEWNPSPTGPGTNGFVSYFEEGTPSDPSTFYYSKYTSNTGIGSQAWFNVKMGFNRYIGIDGSDSLPVIPDYSWDWKLVNIYSEEPTTVDILSYYDVKATKYSKITEFIDVSNLATISSMIFYRGDCFLQRTYHKLIYNPNMYYTEAEVHHDKALYSVLTENVFNTAMRNNTNSSNYYPATDLVNMAIQTGNFEADAFNFGYNYQLSGDGAYGYDVTIPFRADVYQTRVIYSNLHIINAFSDGYRQFDLAAYQDFDLRMGPINAMLNLASRMVIIQQTGISFLYINDRQALTQGSTTAQLLIGNGDILGKKQNTITDIMGTQHQWSVVPTEKALYGVDATKRKIWQLLPDGQLEAISDTKSYRKQLYEIIEQGVNGDRSDITRNIPDNPVCTGGIVGSYERKYNDVIFTFLFDKKSKKTSYSIRFNEWGQHFTDRYDNITAYYIAINEDFFSFNPNIFPSVASTPSGSGAAYLEGVRVTSLGVANNCRFYGVQYQMSLSWITNNASDQEKAFDFIALNASPNEPFSIKYRTINQLATQAPFVNPLEKWNQPSYRENEWRFPIRRADIPQGTVNNIFGINSYMRGTWMQSELVYYTNESIFVKSAITNIRASKQ